MLGLYTAHSARDMDGARTMHCAEYMVPGLCMVLGPCMVHGARDMDSARATHGAWCLPARLVPGLQQVLLLDRHGHRRPTLPCLGLGPPQSFKALKLTTHCQNPLQTWGVLGAVLGGGLGWEGFALPPGTVMGSGLPLGSKTPIHPPISFLGS